MKQYNKEQERDKMVLVSVLIPTKSFSFGLLFIMCIVFLGFSLITITSFHSILPQYTDLFYPKANLTTNHNISCSDQSNSAELMLLKHNMTDHELFRKASMMAERPDHQCRRVPKVAFMFLTRGPLPLAPLWERFFHGHENLFSVYVHASPGYTLNVSNTSAFYGRQIPSQVVEWGRISQLAAERRLLANALLDRSNKRFVLLSESCIAVYSFDLIYEYLTDSIYSYVNSFDEYLLEGYRRYQPEMAPDIEVHQWRKGSSWIELNQELAVIIVSDQKYYSLFETYLNGSFAEEHYPATYIHMFHGSMNSNRTLTWVDWSRGGSHPATFGKEDITVGFISSIRISSVCNYNNENTTVCHLFARKFAPSSLEPLLNISSVAMGY